MNELYGHLTEHRVRLSIRSGVLRLSVGVYNDDADIERVLELAQQV
jgi:selenocysteine lyase/cysteine desulfurase